MPFNKTFMDMGDKAAHCMDCRPGHIFFGREPFLGFIPSFVIWNLIIIGLVAIVFWLLIRGSEKSKKPLTILKQRYAKGEIDGETFHKVKEELSD